MVHKVNLVSLDRRVQLVNREKMAFQVILDLVVNLVLKAKPVQWVHPELLDPKVQLARRAQPENEVHQVLSAPLEKLVLAVHLVYQAVKVIVDPKVHPDLSDLLVNKALLEIAVILAPLVNKG